MTNKEKDELIDLLLSIKEAAFEMELDNGYSFEWIDTYLTQAEIDRYEYLLLKYNKQKYETNAK